MLTPTIRRILLTTHVLLSVGWAGAVAVFLTLALTGLNDGDELTVRSAYIGMQVTTSWLIVPLSFASPLTGLALALGTRWGLVRHYWVLIKAFVTLPATALLLLHAGPIERLADAARLGTLPASAASTQLQMVVDSGLALLALCLAATLGVVKPAGATGLDGRR